MTRPRAWPAPRDGLAFDLLVVGGGATGLGLALEAAQRAEAWSLNENFNGFIL